MQIDDRFDGGNIEVVSSDDPSDVQLRIRKDPLTETRHGPREFFQWFSFRVAGARDVPLTMRIVNAGRAAFPKAWEGYRAVASTDRETWVRVDTTYVEEVLTITHTPTADVVWFAYFAPFSQERQAALIARSAQSSHVRLDSLGRSLDGRTLDRLIIGDGPAAVWVVGRQHPGETMASWWMEGFLARLCDDDDPVAAELRSLATVHVVPMINPDGAYRGHLRTNATGANLNREWAEPSLERSPEVFHTRNAMDATGVDLCLDVHGDEALPYNFIAGTHGVPSWSPARAEALQRFLDDYVAATPEFQQEHGYPRSSPGKGNLTYCSNQTAQRYGCLSMTLEMPFKDNADHPNEVSGWSPERCRRLGAAILGPMVSTLVL
ncbi:MAG: hypothetical protein KDA24_02435 [Deltaproteobacteria bacterium]|nr:hypothetical protein [Deltaproteobacteria bacterium]